VAGTISMRVKQLDVQCETKTRDNVFVSCMVTVQYQVIQESLYDAFYRLVDPENQIRVSTSSSSSSSSSVQVVLSIHPSK